MRRSFSRCVYL